MHKPGARPRHTYSEPVRTDDSGDLGEPWPQVLGGLTAACTRAEESLFATIPILGEPTSQKVLDDWVDHGVDLVRALADHAQELLDRHRVLDVSGAGSPRGDGTVAVDGSVVGSGVAPEPRSVFGGGRS